MRESVELRARGRPALRVAYPPAYPHVPPAVALDHAIDLLELRGGQERACLGAVRAAAVPCAMGCVHAVREFFEGGGLEAAVVRPAVDEGRGDGSQSEGPAGLASSSGSEG